MIKYILRAYSVLNEAWSAPRAKVHDEIFKNISHFQKSNRKSYENNFTKYIKLNKGLSKISPINDWKYCKNLDEYQHHYKSSFFSDGKIRLKKVNQNRVLVFLSGYYSGVEDVFDNNLHPQFLVNDCVKHNLSLASWSSISQKDRGQNALYNNLNSVVSVEREYSRFLPSIGTSIWNEYVNEMVYCIGKISEFYKDKVEIICVGWSMGGAFAHICPLINDNCKLSISAGSLARYEDLINEGKTRLHGYFFFPISCMFDLEDIIKASIKKNAKNIFIFGEKDPGCLKSSKNFLENKFKNESNFVLEEILNYGHFFLPKIKNSIFNHIDTTISKQSYK